MISVRQLSYYIDDTQILDKVNFDLEPSCLFQIQAGNGAGKTTLLQLIAGLKYSDHGTISYFDRSIHDCLLTYQQQLLYLGHQIPLQNQLSVQENWLLMGYSKSVFNHACDYFQLCAVHSIPCGQLSFGQRKKAGLMLLMMLPRNLWILDEPFVGLDQTSVRNLLDLMQRHIHTGGSILLTSHQPLPAMNCPTQSLAL